jgi:signal peptidase complex subunit 3
LGWEDVYLSLNIDANLSLLSNWNLKQVYLYVEAIYDEGEKRNRAILWDTIIKKSDIHKPIQLVKERIEYHLRDVYKNLRGRNVELVLKYEYMPIVGQMSLHSIDSTQLTLPNSYKV